MRSHKTAKRRSLVLTLALTIMLCLAPAAKAEEGVSIEIMTVDGVSVVVLVPELSITQTERFQAADGESAGLRLPQSLTQIGENAFEGIAAECIVISENVTAIEKNAFANCKSLREIHIPPTVKNVDDCALQGCKNVTVYGQKGTEAERFADAAGFQFYDPNADYEIPFNPPNTSVGEAPPVALPLVLR